MKTLDFGGLTKICFVTLKGSIVKKKENVSHCHLNPDHCVSIFVGTFIDIVFPRSLPDPNPNPNPTTPYTLILALTLAYTQFLYQP